MYNVYLGNQLRSSIQCSGLTCASGLYAGKIWVDAIGAHIGHNGRVNVSALLLRHVVDLDGSGVEHGNQGRLLTQAEHRRLL